MRQSILSQPKRLFRFVLPAIFGIPIGISALAAFDPATLKLIVASIMLLYGGFFTLRQSLPKLDRPNFFADGIVGFFGGVMGGAASLSGAFPTMWYAMRPWSKLETRAVLQPFNVTVLGLTMLILASKGVYTWENIKLISVAVPVMMVFAQIGITIFKRLSDDQFRRLLILMMFISGLVLILQGVVW